MEGSGTDFLSIPEGVISAILSLTSPQDTCRSATVASIFRLASEADNIWEKLLPPDYKEILSKSVTPIEFSSKKELYFRLCDPILIDGGTKSFWLDRSTGKKCYILNARQLDICWGDTSRDCTWNSLPESRFSEAAVLNLVWWLRIDGKIKTSMISPKTTYVVYLILKFKANLVRIGSRSPKLKVQTGFQVSRSTAPLCPNHSEMSTWGTIVGGEVRVPCKRSDGWMEIEVGSFYNDDEDDGEVLINVLNVLATYNTGLIIEGMELRPRLGYAKN